MNVFTKIAEFQGMSNDVADKIDETLIFLLRSSMFCLDLFRLHDVTLQAVFIRSS